MNEKNIKSSIKRISYEIVEGNFLDDIVLVGIHTRGVNIAERIRENILLNSGFKLYVNKLNPIHFRDDSKNDALYDFDPSVLKCDITNRTVILVDDVLFTGRTIRASIQALSEYGRAKRIKIAVLIDRGHREIPIKADYVGKNIPTSESEKISVKIKDIDGVDRVDLQHIGLS